MSRLLDGVDDFLRSAGAAVSAYPLTMAIWFWTADVTTDQTLCGIGETGANNHYWRLTARGATVGDPIDFGARATGTEAQAFSSVGYTASAWNHACGVGVSATDRTVYLNGGNTGTNTTSMTPIGPGRTFAGTRDTLAQIQFMNGRLAEFAVWNVALTAGEVNALSKGVCPRNIRPENVAFYAPIWGAFSPEPDYTRNGRHAAVTGAVAAPHPPVQTLGIGGLRIGSPDPGVTTIGLYTGGAFANRQVKRYSGSAFV